jgi:hypothetical protein
MTDLARSGELNGRSGVFGTHPSLDGSSAGLPSAAPFVTTLVRLMAEPVNGLLRRPDNNTDAAVSEHQGVLPSMYQHDHAPIVGVSKSPSGRRHIIPTQRNETGAAR